MKRRIVLKEYFSEGKTKDNNDDDMYIGTDFVAVIDGVSYKSTLKTQDVEIKIAQIIKEALERVDRTNYAKDLDFKKFVKYINWYIANYLNKYNLSEAIGKVEATAVFYSRYHNEIWIVGDCGAIYDGNTVTNNLEIENEVYTDIRCKLIEALLEEGYTVESLLGNDIAKIIIKNPEMINDYIQDDRKRKKLEDYWTKRIKQTLKKCGFSEQEIEEKDLVKTYLNPRDLMQYLKNRPNMGTLGYAVFNGVTEENSTILATEPSNCKVLRLPNDVKNIILFSDGFSIEDFEKMPNIKNAIIHSQLLAKNDPLSIKENRGIHASKILYRNKNGDIRVTDDRTAVNFELVLSREKNIDEGR